jgi:hypothetical protein
MLKGDISITRPQSNHGEKFVNIRLCDNLSGTAFIDVKVAMADFAEALFGLSHVPCSFDLRQVEKVGLKKETCKHRVTVKRSRDDREDAAREACVPFEADGWEADWRSLLNPHYSSSDDDGNTTGMVSFHRWVPVLEQETT